MSSFTYCFNTSTVQGQKLSLAQEIEIASRAGYGAIEPWIGQIETYRDTVGPLSDLRKRISDAGLKVASAIGFAQWIIDDDAARAAGLEHARRDMDLVAQIGGQMIAAPPMGYQDKTGLDLFAAASRYAELMKVGRSVGVLPQLEVWGFSKTLNRLGEALLIAGESGCADAGLLLDIYHLHKGGSGYDTLGLLNGQAIRIFHVNDYPALPREQLTDSHRVYPGDGVAPIRQVLKTLADIGSSAYLSVELFNEDYWQQDALTVANTALNKLKALTPQ
jgi:sugar phosphate isomerase/epimerase